LGDDRLWGGSYLSQHVVKRFETDRDKEELRRLLDDFRSFLLGDEDDEKPIIDSDAPGELLLQDKKKKRKGKPGCSKGNPRHYGTKDKTPPGKKPGAFASSGFRGKGSSSIANDPKYANKKDCKRGRARMTGGQERFISHAQSCGRAGKNKCSSPKPLDEDATEALVDAFAKPGANVKVPDFDGDGMVSVDQFSLALDRKQRQIEKLQAAVVQLKKQKCKNLTAADLIKTTNSLALSLKGKLGDKPKKP
tara:strand:- start:158 stop:904 length:747 start_codon:yes stop_codon:yes gene_type:complete